MQPSSDNTHLSIVSKPAYSQPQCPQLVGIGTRPALANAVHGLLCSDYRRSGMKFGRLPLAKSCRSSTEGRFCVGHNNRGKARSPSMAR